MSDDKAFRTAQMEKFAMLLEDAVRSIKPDADFKMKKMFGGAGYYVDGVMFAGMYEAHTIGLKLNPDDCEALLAIDGAEQGMGKNTIQLPPALLEDEAQFRE
ncbi:MAG: TfoX/Sxy family protein, partial [Chloroflexota bacterium]